MRSIRAVLLSFFLSSASILPNAVLRHALSRTTIALSLTIGDVDVDVASSGNSISATGGTKSGSSSSLGGSGVADVCGIHHEH